MAKTQAEIKNAYAKRLTMMSDYKLKRYKAGFAGRCRTKGTKITRLYQNSLKEAVQGRYRRGNRAVKE